MTSLLKTGRAAQFLLVEDNDCDAELTKIAFQAVDPRIRLHHVWSGDECLAFLRKQGPYTSAPTPDLILLDINMPRMNGFDVLHAIIGDEGLRHLSVVVLSTSDAQDDVVRAYRSGCRSYIAKPTGFVNYSKAIQLIIDYWVTLVELPSVPP